MSWQEWVQLVAAVVAALAAAGALRFAWLTVRQARELRREDQRVRLAALVGDFAAKLLRAVNGDHVERATGLPIARAQLAAALASTGDQLPASRRLVMLDAAADPAEVQLQAASAADELAGNDPAAP